MAGVVVAAPPGVAALGVVVAAAAERREVRRPLSYVQTYLFFLDVPLSLTQFCL